MTDLRPNVQAGMRVVPSGTPAQKQGVGAGGGVGAGHDDDVVAVERAPAGVRGEAVEGHRAVLGGQFGDLGEQGRVAVGVTFDGEARAAVADEAQRAPAGDGAGAEDATRVVR